MKKLMKCLFFAFSTSLNVPYTQLNHLFLFKIQMFSYAKCCYFSKMCFTSPRNGNLLVIALRSLFNPKDILIYIKCSMKSRQLLVDDSVYVLNKKASKINAIHRSVHFVERVNEMETNGL